MASQDRRAKELLLLKEWEMAKKIKIIPPADEEKTKAVASRMNDMADYPKEAHEDRIVDVGGGNVWIGKRGSGYES